MFSAGVITQHVLLRQIGRNLIKRCVKLSVVLVDTPRHHLSRQLSMRRSAASARRLAPSYSPFGPRRFDNRRRARVGPPGRNR